MMGKLSKLIVIKALVLVFTSTAFAGNTTVGTVYGERKWIVYVASDKHLYLRRGSTDFAIKCDTGLRVKGDYVLGPDGSSYKGKSKILSAVQRYLVKGRYKSSGCK